MKLDEETLLEIEDCINALDETVGLNTDTLLDIDKAIGRRRKQLKILTMPVVISTVCECEHPHHQTESKTYREYCRNCEKDWNEQND